ncbi:50S ribosomal protein L15 [Candidatus Woesearchaeota archaeon]|jgi:large subunit ribosomal protein L15|nr:50S ribosomal protein L15 [Candidatus Woesearchaeota archaeon]MBT6520297.1 50S ribosomal protein L15 [Candidatus Woesearchaeota archaeon]MBT7368249.1 50S ribosomal protein L15 [Candidatus Woesearchaeota archaeon]
MALHKRSKNSRSRGTTTHGYGSMKKNRGAGHRGGRGNAGSGKRGDAKKPRYWKEKYFGSKGFTSKSRTVKQVPINIKQLELKLDQYVTLGVVEKSGDLYKIDLSKLGFNKLLGTGNVTKKLEIEVGFCSAKAQSKVEEAGGTVNVLMGDQWESTESNDDSSTESTTENETGAT